MRTGGRLILVVFVTCFLGLVFAAESKYIRSEFAKDLDCSPFFAGSQDSIAKYAKKRIVLDDAQIRSKLPMNCPSIFGRTYFQREDLYPEEKDFPIAFTRVVFTDYYLIERELASTYAPQNFYCYVMDSKSPKEFHDQVRALAKCFPNVFVMEKEFDMDSGGKSMNYAHVECMKALAKPELKWKYMVLLENHDIAIKTNQELIQVFKWYNGANDVNSMLVPPIKELEASGDWSFKTLKLFKDEARNGSKSKLSFTKSLVRISVSREMVDFVINELDLSVLLKRIEDNSQIIKWHSMTLSELMMGTLNGDDTIRVPGGFTHKCLDQKIESFSLTASTFWDRDGPCKTGVIRHYICLLGAEHLQELMSSKYLFANKFMLSMDYGALECWHEKMHNRTHVNRGTQSLKPEIYLNAKHVRFNRERRELGEKFDPSAFNCAI